MSEHSLGKPPKKPDGTTDWDFVFDDPDSGLIALINRVQTTDALQKCGNLIIKTLFKRKNDELDVARFTKELNDIISYAGAIGDIEAIKAEVVVMLQTIKAIRVAKARVYLEEKEKGASANRRSSGATAANTYRFLKSRKFTGIAISGVFVLLILIGGLLYWHHEANAPIDVAAQREQSFEEAKAAREAAGKAAAELKKQKEEAALEKIKAQKALEEKRKAEKIMPPAVVFPGIFIQQNVKGNTRASKPILPIFILEDKGQLSRICQTRPKIVDILNLALSKNVTAVTPHDTIDFVKIAERVRREVNFTLRRSVVTKVLLVSDGNWRDMGTAGDRCTFASDRYFDYIYPPKVK